jgi:hypothetical protein
LFKAFTKENGFLEIKFGKVGYGLKTTNSG